MTEIEDDIGTLPIQDKLDYRKTIHKLLEQTYLTEGTVHFSYATKRLYSCVCTKFPNMDFATEISKKEFVFREAHYDRMEEMKKDRSVWCHPLKHGIGRDESEEKYWLELRNCIRDVLASNRGLLFGHSDSKGVSYSELKGTGEDVAEIEDDRDFEP